MTYEQLKLENQLCFPVYAASRLIIREYQPHLEKLGITYPQYLVLMLLWETDGRTVNEIAQALILNTNTVTPILKRMEALGFIERKRSNEDERRVIISLTAKGDHLREEAVKIPERLVEGLLTDDMKLEDLHRLKEQLYAMIHFLTEKGGGEPGDERT
ncbi:MarR family transcriptional regulator [Levilinea saccharolytica]|uniref:MarR family transcriptional regulator n=2 Tax=Levilinea saccharolytica TaxID=229921 RepID=A0A0N8GP06_9CHLR|nr:MarR family transcriptional regulator [Levilinea saccharolytica]